MRPMLATRTDHVPTGDAWTHEVKWDGVRALTDVGTGGLRMTSRNENAITIAWPELATSPLGERDLLVDGEIIALNDRGLPDFRTLQERMHVRRATTAARLAERVPAIYMVFDLLRLDGRDLTGEPQEVRRGLLEGLGVDGSWQVPAAYDDGAMLVEATRQQGLEGVVSKRRTSTYRPGERTPHWLKLAHRHRLSYVVGGWRPQEGTTDRLAALLVGEQTPDGLVYRGRVGSGIGPRQSRVLAELVAGIGRGDSPFADEVPPVDAQGTHWLEPILVVDIDTHGRGYDRLRQPSFQGVRTDLTPEDLGGDP
ncbi:non-homologous end-joining DNA ligase [Nocardioides sp. LMS-CY]|uniref:non-homologous end-joining DNA ligase n=1 Tax=Nocardioides sp. (strain LMS-CY) TaxID=2840457 RepID=UPI001C00116C|nr:non-homologous end-joining DNA ligase [Nocardioides sp. LMS-CY]QWF23531.1 non-homologous end-joining DNA ligase [Nocardioides sp. LMS-CY]